MKSLTLSNVETVIVFRALSPCVVAFWDAWFLGREYPSTRSWCGLGIIVAGAYGYASFDEKFQTQGWQAYTWPTIYLFIISFEMAYGKKIVKSVDLRTLSGPVLYTNLLGLPPMLMFAWAGNEYSKASEDWEKGVYIPTIAFVALFLGCVAGTGIGYSGWWCRGKVSATTYTLIGVINKCLTILLNLVIWDKHAPPGGIASLLLCLVGGAIYQQAPMRKDAVASDKAAVADGQNDEEKQELVQQDVLKRRTEGGSPSRSRSPKRDGDVI
jgi:GDP-mannose transporter